MVYRRFGYIQSRLLVEKQNDLQLLEDELDELDCNDEAEDSRRLQTRRDYDKEHMQERVRLLEQIERKWLEYCMQHPSRKSRKAHTVFLY